MLAILEEEGVDMELVAVGHSDRNADPYYHLKLAEKGAYVQFDGCGKVKYYPDSTRVELVKICLKMVLGINYSSQEIWEEKVICTHMVVVQDSVL